MVPLNELRVYHWTAVGMVLAALAAIFLIGLF